MSLNKEKEIPILLIGGKGGGVSEGIYKCLNLAGYKNVTLLEYNKNNALFYRINNKLIIDKTPDDGEFYILELIRICKNNSINIIIPGTTWEANIISKYKEMFNSNNIFVLVNNYNTISICADKREFIKYLNSHNIPVPVTFDRVDDAIYYMKQNNESMVVKPVWGRGSQNIFFAKSEQELNVIVEYFKIKSIDFIIQQNISSIDHEYTVGALSDKNGKFIQSITMKRQLFGGATGYAKIVEDPNIDKFSKRVAEIIGSTGPINIQFRTDKNGVPMMFEINPRFSGSAPMRALSGFNELDAIINNYVFNKDIDIMNINSNLEFYRVFQEIYTDYSDSQYSGKIEDYI